MAPTATPPPAAVPIHSRVWSAGRLLVLATALAVTYGAFFLTSMRVATRAREVKVPDVRGKSLTVASQALTAAGLAVRLDPLRRPDPTVPADHVLTQEPEAGAIIRRERAVRLRVSEGVRAPVIPAVVGMTERAAEMTLTQEHIQVTARAEVHTSQYDPGVVVAQDPPAKSRGAGITLLINRARSGDSYVMPDLIGTPGQRAADVLRKQGFIVAITAETPYPGLPRGIVIRQNPQPGFQLAIGEPVSLEISR
jgi:beta-lactam-binding protein with PASTA domain